jgi:hypothetical protein
MDLMVLMPEFSTGYVRTVAEADRPCGEHCVRSLHLYRRSSCFRRKSPCRPPGPLPGNREMSNVSNRPVGVREYRFLGERLHVVQVDICCSWILFPNRAH